MPQRRSVSISQKLPLLRSSGGAKVVTSCSTRSSIPVLIASLLPSAAEHPVYGVGDLVPTTKRMAEISLRLVGRVRAGVGYGSRQRVSTNSGDINLVTPFLNLVMQVVRNLDRIAGQFGTSSGCA